MRVIRFRLRGKLGHFLRAEANVDGLTYPVPPPTALLGMVGAVLGLGKDEPQEKLAGARLAVAARNGLPLRFWHTTNIRKDPPAPLPQRVKRSDRGTSSAQRNMRFAQEWLWRPDYLVWASLPEPYHDDLLDRLQERRWHFTPCMGLASMFADLEEPQEIEASPLASGVYSVVSIAPQDAGELEMEAAFSEGLTLQSLSMSNRVDGTRTFQHRAYWLETQGRPFPFRTNDAFQCGDAVVVWL